MAFRTPPLPLRHPACLIATWFGVGLMATAPGTWGSLAALPFAWGIMWAGGPLALAAATVLVTLAGWWAGNIYIEALGREDPGDIVVDEVAGIWLTVIPAGLDIGLYGAGFVLFRIADILKPWPARWADKNVKGGLGAMVDDLFAALYSAAGVLLLAWLLED